MERSAAWPLHTNSSSLYCFSLAYRSRRTCSPPRFPSYVACTPPINPLMRSMKTLIPVILAKRLPFPKIMRSVKRCPLGDGSPTSSNLSRWFNPLFLRTGLAGKTLLGFSPWWLERERMGLSGFKLLGMTLPFITAISFSRFSISWMGQGVRFRIRVVYCGRWGFYGWLLVCLILPVRIAVRGQSPFSEVVLLLLKVRRSVRACGPQLLPLLCDGWHWLLHLDWLWIPICRLCGHWRFWWRDYVVPLTILQRLQLTIISSRIFWWLSAASSCYRLLVLRLVPGSVLFLCRTWPILLISWFAVTFLLVGCYCRVFGSYLVWVFVI